MGGKGSGRKPKTVTKEMTDYLRDSAYADALVQESLGRILDEKNAEIWDNERQVIPTTTILDWFMNNMLKASATLLFFVAALYLGVRV